MSKFLFWLFVFVFGVAVTIFSVNNREVVAIDAWPAQLTIDWPVFGVALVGIGVGFLWGAIVTWLGGGRTRRKMRELARDMEALLREKAHLSQRLAKSEGSGKQPAVQTPSADAA